MLEHYKIDISDGININKTNAWKRYNIGHYWYFLDKGFKYEPYHCNFCHDLMQKAMRFNDFAIFSVKGSEYRTQFCYMSKDDSINMMKNCNLNEKVDYYKSFYIKNKWWNYLL